jgi:hypothetical protein
MSQKTKPLSDFIVCPWCGAHTRLEFIHGHYACMACHRPVVDCCDGEAACNTEEQE